MLPLSLLLLPARVYSIRTMWVFLVHSDQSSSSSPYVPVHSVHALVDLIFRHIYRCPYPTARTLSKLESIDLLYLLWKPFFLTHP